MRRLTAVAAIALLFALPSEGITQQQPAQGSIDGVVMRADTGTPLAGAQVNLSGPPPAGAIPTMTTDGEGKFSFKGLGPGSYYISARAEGFAPGQYGQQGPNSLGTPLALTANQALRDLAIRLAPTATIAGKILDENGQPAVGAPVRILRTLGNAPAQRYQSAGATTVDDRGQYRLYGVAPGSYYVSVGEEVGGLPRPATPGNPNPGSAADYAFQLYPGVPDVNQAVPVEVSGGSEITIDMKVRRRPQTFRVRGTIIDAATGRPPLNPRMKLIFKTLTGGSESPLSPVYTSTTGRFEVPNVPPGSHILQANIQILDATARAAGEAAWSMFPTARVPIVVTDKDLEDIALILTRPIAVPGRVRIEGTTLAIPNGTLHLEPVAGETQWRPPTAFVQPDGVFRVDGLVDGQYSVTFQSALRSHYVKSIQYEGADILTQPWRFSGSGAGTIEVVLRPNAAQLSGVVTNARSQPVSRGYAVLVPDQRDRKDLYRFAPLDANGRFNFTGVVPGDYKLFSWEQGLNMDPEFIKRFEEQGKRIHIVESANDTVDIRVIPLP